MYTGEIINDLMQMVARAEEHAHSVRGMELAGDEEAFTSRFMYVPDAPPMMIGVA